MLAAPAARGDGALVDLMHLGMVVLAGPAEVGEEVVGADQHQIDAVDRDDLLHRGERSRRLELHDHHGGLVHPGQRFGRRHAAEAQVRQARRQAARPDGRILRRRHHRARFAGGADARRNHAERAAVEHALDDLRRARRHAHQRGDPGFQRHYGNLRGGFDRERGVLEVDVDRIEAGGLGDAHDLDARHQAHRHRRGDLAARELVLQRIQELPPGGIIGTGLAATGR